jgi:hypothetical protein
VVPEELLLKVFYNTKGKKRTTWGVRCTKVLTSLSRDSLPTEASPWMSIWVRFET